MKKIRQTYEPVNYTPINYNRFSMVLLWLAIAIQMSAYAQDNSESITANTAVKNKYDQPAFGMDYPGAVKIPGNINSSQDEIRPFLSDDGKTLYFSRQHYLLNIQGLLGYEDLWRSTYNNITKVWNDPVSIGPPIRNFGPNSVNYIRINNDTIVIANEFRMNGKFREGISMSLNEGGEWTFLQPFGTIDNDSVVLINHNISCNSHQPILTASNRDGSYGNMDIYVTLIKPDGTLKTMNLGAVVNTAKDESSPYLAADNRTLYFASKGHAGYGGFDIYVTHRLDDSWEAWSTPENLGPSINTDEDEEFYVCPPESPYAYFSREVSGRNSDIYQVAVPIRQQASEGRSNPENHY